jgi:signal transduction histidine kinase
MGIRYKLILAYGILFVVAVGAMGFVVTRFVSDAVENRLAVEAENAGRTFSNWNPPLEPDRVANAILRVYGADVAVQDGGRWGSTLDAPSQAAVEAAHRGGRLASRAASPAVVSWRLADGRETVAVCIPYRPREANALESPAPPPEGTLILFYPADQVANEIGRARRPLLAILFGGLILVAVLGVWVAHTITRPLEQLAARTREIAAGHLESGRADPPPAVAGGAPGAEGPRPPVDEVAQLSVSFDRMIDGLRQYQENLLRSEKLAVAGRMAAGIAHEIRNPLTAMSMTVQMLARETSDPERRQALDLLRAEIGRIEDAVGELMDLASPAPPRREPVDLNAVVEEVLALVQPQADHQGIAVERRLAPLPPVPADPKRVRRVVLNLVLNGIQAMPERGQLTVGTSASTAAVPVVRLVVADTGPGIPPGVRGRVFDPFVSGKEGGTGLGLAVTKRVVEEHGGRIGFETGSGGTTFWVELDGLRT